MPSWNIHTAHAEHVLSRGRPEALGITDGNAFLFGNYVPDIYVGYMVPNTTMRMDYLLTHVAQMDIIPVPDADRFWDLYIAHRMPKTEAGISLVLGAWAHLVADRYYNGNFRQFCRQHALHADDDLRVRKQGDFDLFGRSLKISRLVDVTPELLDAADGFCAYRVLPDDVRRAVDVATGIVHTNTPENARFDHYQLLGATWLQGVFDACDQRVVTWLKAWQRLARHGEDVSAASVRAAAGLAPATPDGPQDTTVT